MSGSKSLPERDYFCEELAAFEFLERIVWSARPYCPPCGGSDRITKVTANPAKRIRIGLWRCGVCKRQFTIKIGTLFEQGHIPLHKALQAAYLMTSCRKPISARQLHRVLEVTYKSAWHLARRIRDSMHRKAIEAFGDQCGAAEGKNRRDLA